MFRYPAFNRLPFIKYYVGPIKNLVNARCLLELQVNCTSQVIARLSAEHLATVPLCAKQMGLLVLTKEQNRTAHRPIVNVSLPKYLWAL